MLKFVGARKDSVFKELPITISLLSIVQKLDLDIKQTKKYYSMRSSQIQAEHEYITLSSSLLDKEHQKMREDTANSKVRILIDCYSFRYAARPCLVDSEDFAHSVIQKFIEIGLKFQEFSLAGTPSTWLASRSTTPKRTASIVKISKQSSQ